MTVIYGISNCDTVRKARRWMEEHQLDYRFHDFRKDGMDASCLQGWVVKTGWQALLNKRSASWRALPESDTRDLTQERAIALMLQNPTLIKRPVLVHSGQVTVGFTEADYQNLLP